MIVAWLALVSRAGDPPEVRVGADGAVWLWTDEGWSRVLAPLPELELEPVALPVVALPEVDPDDPDAAVLELRRRVDEAAQDRARMMAELRSEADRPADEPSGARAWFDPDGLWVVRADGEWFSPDRGLTWTRRAPTVVPASAAPWASPAPARAPDRWWPTLAVDLTWVRTGARSTVSEDRGEWFDVVATLRWDLARRSSVDPTAYDPYEAAGRVWVGDDPSLARAVGRWTAARAAEQRRRAAEWAARRARLDAAPPPLDLRAAVLRELERQQIDAHRSAFGEG